MKKTSDEELNLWRYQDKRAPVSLNVIGDHDVAKRYMGEAKALLWSVKNALSLNKQMDGQGEHRLTDGTIIRVKCVYGLDIIEIDTSTSILAAGAQVAPESCSITFISLPASVPPMRNPGVIKAMELAGVDYFKSYYSFKVNSCPTCRSIAWDFLFTFTNPAEPRHYVDPITNKSEPANHSVYSLSPPAWGEIIDHGRDGAGYFILWKAYTESEIKPSRTGLGIMLLTAAISNPKGVLCSQKKKIDVDCCKKKDDQRTVEIWWEGTSYGTCQPFIFYGGIHLCKMPLSQSIVDFVNYSTPYYLARPLYAIPDIKGGCIPFKWSSTGPIKLVTTEPRFGLQTYFQVLPFGCDQPVSITLEDRCGKTYTVAGSPCCTDAAPLDIGYTSLVMSCGQQQDLTGEGGCEPYQWSLAGGGFLSADNGKYIIYHAPATNPNCVSNPTITLTDCCGNSKSISLAINCWSGAGAALERSTSIAGVCGPPSESLCPDKRNICIAPVVAQEYVGGWQDYKWRCDGALLSFCDTVVTRCVCQDGCGLQNCYTNECGGAENPATCGALYDVRTDAQKAGGCCPLNPDTGLPY